MLRSAGNGQVNGWRIARIVAIALACSGILAACGGGGSAAPTATVGPTLTPTAIPPTSTPVPDATIGKIVWTESVDSTTNAPGKTTDGFKTNTPAIYAVVRVTDLHAGSVLSAAWTYNGTVLNGTSSSVVPNTLVVKGYVQFHLARGSDSVWPDGTYAVTISLDGSVVRTATIDIVDS